MNTISKAKFFAAHEEKLNTRQLKVVERLFREGPKGFVGGLSAKNYISIVRTTSSTATRDLRSLVDMLAFAKNRYIKSHPLFFEFRKQ